MRRDGLFLNDATGGTPALHFGAELEFYLKDGWNEAIHLLPPAKEMGFAKRSTRLSAAGFKPIQAQLFRSAETGSVTPVEIR